MDLWQAMSLVTEQLNGESLVYKPNVIAWGSFDGGQKHDAR